MSQEVAIDPKMRQSWNSRNENPWLNGLGLEEAGLNELRGIQNTYVVQLDQYPIFGYAWYIWLLWDHDRLWGRFNFGNTEGIFLVDPGVNPSLCDEDGGQELLFTWRGVQKLKPNIFYCNELITKGKIRIYPRTQKIEGFFEYMDGDGCPGEKPGDKCEFHAEGYYEPPVVPYTLEDTVELWNYYLPVSSEKERVRQFLPSSEGKSDLRKREWVAVVTIDSEVANDGGSVISTNENGGNDASLVRQECVGTQESVTESADSSVMSMSSDSQESRDSQETVTEVADNTGMNT